MVDSYRFLGGVANSARPYPQFCSSAVVCVRRPSCHFSATSLKKRGHDAELQSRAQLGERVGTFQVSRRELPRNTMDFTGLVVSESIAHRT